MHNPDYIVSDSHHFIHKNRDRAESLTYKYTLKNQSCVGSYICFQGLALRFQIFSIESSYLRSRVNSIEIPLTPFKYLPIL